LLRKNILIVGAGRLAVRHCEGLQKSSHKINLFVFDVSKFQLSTLENKINYREASSKISTLKCFTNLKTLNDQLSNFDMIIVSSTAKNRDYLLKNLFNNFKSKYWLVEKPLTQSVKGLKRIMRAHKNENVWVNHFRRIVPWQEEIKNLMIDKGPLTIDVQSPSLGIACNISHYIDLTMYWTGEIPIQVNTKALDKKWIPSKRPLFFEIEGTIKINFSGGTKLKIISSDKVKQYLISVSSPEEKKDFIINEENEMATSWNDKNIPGKMLLQSEMTGWLFDELESKQSCSLPTLEEAIKGYAPIIEALELHWNKCSNEPYQDIVPIT